MGHMGGENPHFSGHASETEALGIKGGSHLLDLLPLPSSYVASEFPPCYLYSPILCPYKQPH